MKKYKSGCRIGPFRIFWRRKPLQLPSIITVFQRGKGRLPVARINLRDMTASF